MADGTLVAAADSSGIWLLREGSASRLQLAGRTGSLHSVERGPDHPFQIYAGGDTMHVTGDLTNWNLISLPPGVTRVSRVAVTGSTRRIYLATNAGIFWSELPVDYVNGSYTWSSGSLPANYRSVCVWSDQQEWSPWRSASPLSMGSAVSAVCRFGQQVDLFAVDAGGAVRTSWGDSTNLTMSPWHELGSGDRFAVPGRLAAVTRHPMALDVVALAPDGTPRATRWPTADPGGWGPWYTIGRPGVDRLDVRGPVALVSRTPESLDLLGIGPDGHVYHNRRPAPEVGRWETWRLVGGPSDRFAAAGGVTAVTRARGPHLDRGGFAHTTGPDAGHLDVFAVDPDGQVRTTWTDDGGDSWGAWYVVGNAAARLDPASGASALSRRSDHLDVFARGLDGGIYSSWWHEGQGWSSWFRIGRGTIGSGTRIVAVAPNPEEIHLIVMGSDSQPWASEWTAEAGTWTPWLPIADGTAFNPRAGVAAVSPHRDDLLVVGAVGEEARLARWAPTRDRVYASTYKAAGDNVTPAIVVGSYSVSAGSVAGLQLERAPVVQGASTAAMATTTVAMSAYRPRCAYAVSSDGDSTGGRIASVVKTVDGGTNWTACPTTVVGTNPQEVPTLQALSGGQGDDWNNCIAVDPSEGRTAIIGWVDRFVSTDGGSTWQRFLRDNPHGHPDHHGVRFDTGDSTGRTVLVASDGGVCLTRDLGSTADSSANRLYANLEFYARNSRRQSYGGMGSGQVAGLVAGGTQDNANIWCRTLPTPTPWRKLGGGDGGLCLFVANGDLLQSQPMNGIDFSLWQYDSSDRFVSKGDVPIARGRPDDITRTGIGGAACPVREPVSRDIFGAKVYAIACPFPSGDIYTGWSGNIFNPFRWEFELTLPLAPDDSISAFASVDSTVIFCGTNNGRLFRVDALDRTVVETAVIPTAPDRVISQIAAVSNTLAYALYSDKRSDQGQILALTPSMTWVPVGGTTLPGTLFYGIEVDVTTSPATVFACNDDGVFLSRDNGGTWSSASAGLPAHPKCADVCLSREPDGTKVLHLSTYGMSMWQSTVS